MRLTLGHGTALGNPRSVAADRMARSSRAVEGRIDMRVAGSAQLGDDLAMLTGLRTGTRRHVGEQPGPGLDRGAGPGRLRPALPVPDQPGRLRGHRRPGRAGARQEAGRGRADLARLVGQRHPPHHQQQALDHRSRPTCAASRSEHPPIPPPSTPSRRSARRRSRSTSASSTSPCSRAWSTGRRTRSPTSTRASCTR